MDNNDKILPSHGSGGKLVAIVPAVDADKVITAMKKHPYDKNAATIGEIIDAHPGRVVMKTVLGTTRVVDMLVGDPLPRIC